MSLAQELADFSLPLSLGAIQIGVLFATLFYGMTFVQTYIYTLSCSQDRVWLKIFVGVVAVLETLHTCLVWMYLWHLTISNFGNSLALLGLPWYFDLSIAIQGLVSVSVQVFYTWRIYNVSKKWWLVVPVFALELFRLGITLALAGLAWQTGSLPAFRAKADWTVYLALSTSVVVDVWNTTALCFYLRSRRAAITKTIDILNSIMMWAVETGMITTGTAALVLATWTTMPDNGLWACFLVIYAKIFSNSLMVSLNSRSSATDGRSSSAYAVSSPPGVVVSRSFTVEVSGADGLTESSGDLDVPLDDMKGFRGGYAV